MATEKELKVKITADANQFKNSIKGVNTSLDGLLSNFTRFQLSAAGVVAAMGAVGGGLAKIIKSTADYGDELAKTSQKVGVSVEALAGLNYAASLADVTNEQLANGLKKLSINLSDTAQGLGEARYAFQAMDISVLDANGNLRSSEAVLLEVARKFKDMEDGTGKTAIAIKLFGKAGADLIPLLNSGADGIKRTTDEAKEFGLIIDEKAAKAAETFNDNMTRLRALTSGIAVSIGNELIPAINKMVEELEKAARSEGWKILTPQGTASWFFKKGADVGDRLGGGWTGGAGVFGGPKKGKAAAPLIVDPEIARKAEEVAEKADMKRLANMEKWATAEFNFQQQVADMRNAKHDEWIAQQDEKAAKAQEVEDAIWQAAVEGNRKAIEAQEARQDAIVGSLAFIGRSALSEHKVFFNFTKAANIATATMDTYAAAQKAMAQLGAWGWPVAAAITAAGIANVAKIASTPFGGRGSGGSAASSQTSGAGIGAQGLTSVANQPSSVQVVVHGNIIDHAAFVRELQPYFREVVVDTV